MICGVRSGGGNGTVSDGVCNRCEPFYMGGLDAEDRLADGAGRAGDEARTTAWHNIRALRQHRERRGNPLGEWWRTQPPDGIDRHCSACGVRSGGGAPGGPTSGFCNRCADFYQAGIAAQIRTYRRTATEEDQAVAAGAWQNIRALREYRKHYNSAAQVRRRAHVAARAQAARAALAAYDRRQAAVAAHARHEILDAAGRRHRAVRRHARTVIAPAATSHRPTEGGSPMPTRRRRRAAPARRRAAPKRRAAAPRRAAPRVPKRKVSYAATGPKGKPRNVRAMKAPKLRELASSSRTGTALRRRVRDEIRRRGLKGSRRKR